MTSIHATNPEPQSTATANHRPVVVIDFGSQTAQLIARRIRELGTLAILESPDKTAADIQSLNPLAIVLSGGPASVYAPNAPACNPDIFKLNIPVLGICYGLQAACHALGSSITPANHREYGSSKLNITNHNTLLASVPDHTTVWMSHGDQINDLDTNAFTTLASTPTCPHAAVKHTSLPFYGTQFHPEVTHTPHGTDILRNFLHDIAHAPADWKMSSFMHEQIDAIKKRVGDHRVICGLSGGVDSSVTAALLHQAIGDQLSCVFVDNGLLRKNETQRVQNAFADHFNIDLHTANDGELFLADLTGITDPQQKRKAIGARFIDSFKRAATLLEQKRGPFTYLAQGTLYPDVIESGHGYAGKSANIKLHHNVGGLPEQLGFELVEPLRDLFKDEVRKLGEALGLPKDLVWRHPFPGPGLAVRIIGEVTEDKLAVLRDCDEILLEEIIAADQYDHTAQVFAVLLPVRSVGVMGDARTYDNAVAVRAVTSTDFMTADWARLPHDLLARISNRIINEVKGVNRVVYDISSKPPATVEWE